MLSGRVAIAFVIAFAAILLAAGVRFVCAVGRREAERAKERPRAQNVALVLMAVVCTAMAGKVGLMGLLSHMFSGGLQPANGMSNALGGDMLNSPPPMTRQFTADELEARFVLLSVDTNVEWSAAMPVGAVEPTTWPQTGAFKDKYENLSVGGWEFPHIGAFPFGTNEVTRMAFLAQGEARPDLRDESTHISALAGATAIPRSDLLAASGANFQSRFWTLHTPTNALYTWENSLFLDRTMPTYPVSFQIEIFPGGNFTLRHDISSLDDTAWQTFTNSVRTGAQWHGHGEMIDLSLLPKYSKAEFRYHALDERDLTDPDRDNDGITTADEIFIYHTDPGNPDTDYDGLSDLDEIFGYHTDAIGGEQNE